MKNLKLWQKQYLSTLVLFILAFYGCVFFIIQSSFSTAFSAAQDAAAQEFTMIKQAIEAEQSVVAGHRELSAEIDAAITAKYGNYYIRKGVGLIYTDSDGNVLYKSTDMGFTKNTKEKGRLYIIKDSSGDRFFYASASLTKGTLSYFKNTENLFTEQKKQNIILLISSFVFVMILTVVLYFTLKRLFRPIHNLAHELRTPLTAINGYAQYIAYAAADEEERLNAAVFIIDESRRLQDIADKLLTLSNRKEGEKESTKVSVEKLFLRIKQIYPKITCRSDLKYVTGDPALLSSLVGNLAENAVKASGEETVELISEGNRITVNDRGAGLSEEMLKKLNDPTPEKRISTTGSAGLGIALCHKIAAQHNARLKFENREGGGTAATVIFLQLGNNTEVISKHSSGTFKKNRGGKEK